jgi:hypothetical protein
MERNIQLNIPQLFILLFSFSPTTLLKLFSLDSFSFLLFKEEMERKNQIKYPSIIYPFFFHSLQLLLQKSFLWVLFLFSFQRIIREKELNNISFNYLSLLFSFSQTTLLKLFSLDSFSFFLFLRRNGEKD